MLAQPVEGEPKLVGQFDFFEQVLEPLGRALQRVAVQRIGRVFGERIKSEFHLDSSLLEPEMACRTRAIKNAHGCNRVIGQASSTQKREAGSAFPVEGRTPAMRPGS